MTEIQHVSDTALWVAVYRARESERPDALFRDPYAARLAGDKGRGIAGTIPGSRQVEWTVVIRTVIIDQYIQEFIARGGDTVVNLGAGLDTRPYRMDLPASLRWIEVDFPHMIDLKDEKLGGEKPRCRLERRKADLSVDAERRALLAQIGAESKRILVLTEGVIPYLSPGQVGALADDLRAQPSIRHWIVEYHSPQMGRYLQRMRTGKHMRNAPFRFFPADWYAFFKQHGWRPAEMRYTGDESLKLGRVLPGPWWARILMRIFPDKVPEEARHMAGYALLEPLPA